MIIINASAAKYGTTWITASAWIIPNTGPMMTPRIIKNATSGIPVFLKNASPATPRNITTPAASNIIGAVAIGSSCIDNEEIEFWISINLFKINVKSISDNDILKYARNFSKIMRTDEDMKLFVKTMANFEK